MSTLISVGKQVSLNLEGGFEWFISTLILSFSAPKILAPVPLAEASNPYS